jgi:hypothetical protein
MEWIHLKGFCQQILEGNLGQDSLFLLVRFLEYTHKAVNSYGFGVDINFSIFDLILPETALDHMQIF